MRSAVLWILRRRVESTLSVKCWSLFIIGIKGQWSSPPSLKKKLPERSQVKLPVLQQPNSGLKLADRIFLLRNQNIDL